MRRHRLGPRIRKDVWTGVLWALGLEALALLIALAFWWSRSP